MYVQCIQFWFHTQQPKCSLICFCRQYMHTYTAYTLGVEGIQICVMLGVQARKTGLEQCFVGLGRCDECGGGAKLLPQHRRPIKHCIPPHYDLCPHINTLVCHLIDQTSLKHHVECYMCPT